MVAAVAPVYVHMTVVLPPCPCEQGARLNPDASKWTVEDVSKWLKSRGLQEHVYTFEKNDINGTLLLRLDKDTLEQELHLAETVALQVLDEINLQEQKMFLVEQWSEEDVIAWISALGLAEHAPAFRYHNVTGSLLLELNKTDIMEDLKVHVFGQRQTLLEALTALKKRIVKGGVGVGGSGARAGHGVRANPMSAANELALLEKKKAERLKAELEALKKKVNHARDAEARAKALARQAEQKAGSVEQQLTSLESKLKERKAAPPPNGKGAAAGKKAIVTGWIDQCTFKPALNQKSRKLTEANRQTFDERLQAQMKKKKQDMEKLAKNLRALPEDPGAEEVGKDGKKKKGKQWRRSSEAEKLKDKEKAAFEFLDTKFKSIAWDNPPMFVDQSGNREVGPDGNEKKYTGGVQDICIDKVLTHPKHFGLNLPPDNSTTVAEAQKKASATPGSSGSAPKAKVKLNVLGKIRKLTGAKQRIALFDQFNMEGFVQRQVEDLVLRAKSSQKESEGQAKRTAYLESAKKYMTDRFNWSAVSDARLDDLIDNAFAFELEFSETDLAGAVIVLHSAACVCLAQAVCVCTAATLTCGHLRARRVSGARGLGEEDAGSIPGAADAGVPATQRGRPAEAGGERAARHGPPGRLGLRWPGGWCPGC